MANEIYNTTWWGNAIDTAITAGTEPDFFGSQMKMLTSEQDNLVTNGDFSTNTDWTITGSATISSGLLNINNNAAAYDTRVENVSTVTTGKMYLIQYTISNYSSGSARLRLGSTYSNIQSSNGTFSEYIESNGTSIKIYASSSNTVLDIDNVSVTLARAEEVEAVKCLADWIHTTALQDLNN